MSFTIYNGYIEKMGGDGWLNVIFNDGLRWSLPEYLQVQVTKSTNREEFTILEGRWKGKKASMQRKGWSLWDWDGSYFEENIRRGSPHRTGAEMTYYRKSKELKIVGLGTYNLELDPNNPIPLGAHDTLW